MADDNDKAELNGPTSDELAAALSDEERAALVEAGELEGEADEDAAGDDDGGADDTAGDETVVKDPAKAEAAPVVDAQADDDDDFVPDLTGDPKRIEAIDARLTEIAAAAAEAKRLFSEGEKNMEEYLDEKEKLDEEKADLRADKREIERGTELTAKMSAQKWEHQQVQFFANDENAIFRQDKDPVMFEALSAQVRLLGKQYLDAGANKSGAAILREAADKVRERFGMVTGKGQDSTDAKAAAAAAKKAAAAARSKKQADAQKGVPLTVVDLPSAGDPDVEADGEFAELDAMLGDPDRMMEAEMMLSRMSPEQQLRFAKLG